MMGACSQQEVDDVVIRVKKAIEKYGAESEELEKVRTWYEMLRRCAEHGALVVLESELDKLGV